MRCSRLLRAALIALAVGLCVAGCQKNSDLPTLGTIGAFSLTNQSKKSVTAADLRGKVWVAAFMFTRCPTVCPRMMRHMKALQDGAKQRSIELELVSFSVDPENDTPQALLAFANKYGADLDSWSFLTGDIEVIKRTSVDGFKLALDGRADPQKADFGILHGSYLVLVDPQLQIRGYYSTQDTDVQDRLLKDAAGLAE